MLPPMLEPILVLITLLALIGFGLPIFLALGLSGLLGLYMDRGSMAFFFAPSSLFGQLNSFELIALPLFILMGNLLGATPVGASLFQAAVRWLNWLRGSLAISSVGASAMFGAVSGVSLAGVAAVGSIAVLQMLERGYSRSLAAGSVVSAGAFLIAAVVFRALSLRKCCEIFGATAGGGGILEPEYIWSGEAKPVRSLEDLRGEKVRVVSFEATKALEPYGIAAVRIPSSETYMALQRGTVDAGVFNISTVIGRSLQEQLAYCYKLPTTGFTVAPFILRDPGMAWGIVGAAVLRVRRAGIERLRHPHGAALCLDTGGLHRPGPAVSDRRSAGYSTSAAPFR